MKKYLISLDKDQHRRTLFFSQENTQDFEIFSAFNTMNENKETLATRFNLVQFSQYYGREATHGEVGCTLSHLGVYQKIVQDGDILPEEYALICEDDALFNTHFQENLEKIISLKSNADIILLGQSKIKSFNDIELEINYPTTFAFLQQKTTAYPFRIAYPYKNYFAGTVAYLIKKSAAQKILQQINATQLPSWLADDFILFDRLWQLDIQIVRPLLVIENPRLNSNLASHRDAVAHPFWLKLLKYPLKKCLAVKRNLRK